MPDCKGDPAKKPADCTSHTDCPYIKETGGGFEGERYDCSLCGEYFWLDYALISQLERAEEGSRELDVEIALACGWRRVKREYADTWSIPTAWIECDSWADPDGKESAPPLFTSSLDAARKLAPPDMLINNLGEMRDSGSLTGQWLAQLSPRGPRRKLAQPVPITAQLLRDLCDVPDAVRGATAELALVIACLKARLVRCRQGAPTAKDPQG